MTFANAADLIRLLLRQSDRHPVRVIGAAELEPYDPRFRRSLRNLGVLVPRVDLPDDGGSVFGVIDGSLIVVDPETGDCERHDDALDIQTFDIDVAALCRAIREQSGLNGPGPTAISSRIWRLGRYQQHGRAAEICLVRRLREETAQEILDHVRGAIDTETSVALVSLGSSELPTVVTRQLDRLRMTVSRAEDLLRDDPVRPFALDLGRVRLAAGKQASDARLQVDRIGRRAIFDGVEIDIEPRDFDAAVLLGEEALAAGGWVSKESLAAAIQASTGRESNPEQVDRCINRLRDAFRKNPQLSSVPRNGFIDRKSKVGARFTLSPSDIAFIA
jgi:DNA-binding response OmpR family regulator